tara:strand:- start:8545 stop:9507 length:963 start_codon:yes stop_codon:yes gene_type:complete
MENTNYQNQLLNQRVADDHADELKKVQIEHKMEIDDKNNEMRSLRENELVDLKNKVETYQETMNKRYTSLEMEKEKSTLASRQKLKNSLDRQRTEFGRTLNQINASNEMAMSDLREEMTKEQSRFIEDTREKVHDKMADMKVNYEDKVRKTESSLSQKLEQKTKENETLTAKYEQKLDVLRTKSAKELEALKKLEHDKREEDKKANERALASQRREFQKNIMSMKREYDQKLDRAKANSDLHVTKLTERYENQIATERAEHNKELQRQNSMLKTEYNRLAEQNKLEKDSIINQYEIKLNKLREANRVANEIKNSRQNDMA